MLGPWDEPGAGGKVRGHMRASRADCRDVMDCWCQGGYAGTGNWPVARAATVAAPRTGPAPLRACFAPLRADPEAWETERPLPLVAFRADEPSSCPEHPGRGQMAPAGTGWPR
jgi:hypothetical protein